MIDRRGHRKLRLTSRKYFKPKPKQSQTKDAENEAQCPQVAKLPCPLANKPPCPPEELKISLPVSSYADSPLTAIDELRGRLKKQGSIPSGTYTLEKVILSIAVFD